MNETIPITRQREAGPAEDQGRGLSVVSIAKSYDKKVVLSDVSLSIDRGEVLGLLGPWCRQDTSFYSIMGLVKPDSGRILLDGQDITGLPDVPPRRSWALATAAGDVDLQRADRGQNIMAGWRSPSRTARPQERLEQLLSDSTSSGCADAPATPSPGGERRAADRPRVGRQSVDHAARRAVRRHRSDLDRRHSRPHQGAEERDIGVLITDHNVRETLDIVDRACIIYGGQVLFAGSPRTWSATRMCGGSTWARASSFRVFPRTRHDSC
jgi:lipopolysaccharide export system ATP-binding protein